MESRMRRLGRQKLEMGRVVARGCLSRLRRVEGSDSHDCLETLMNAKGMRSAYCFLFRARSLGMGVGMAMGVASLKMVWGSGVQQEFR